MGKRFNVTGRCYPEVHYMVDITEKLRKIKAMVDQGDYFCMNRKIVMGRPWSRIEFLRHGFITFLPQKSKYKVPYIRKVPSIKKQE